MSERRGPQGVQGVQGIEGIEGPAIPGAPGEKGEKGEKGERGKVLPRSITLSFFAVVLIATLVLLSLSWQIRVTRNLSAENQRSVEFLCNTTMTLDAVLVVPFLTETRLAVKVIPVGEDKARLLRLRNNLEIAHAELSSTSACEGVR